jgi:PRC-barrel domain
MRVKRLFASMITTSLALAATLATTWAADEAVPPPVAGAPSELAPTPTPTPTPQESAAPQAAPKEASKPKEPLKEQPPKEPPPASVTILSAREVHGVLGRDVRSAANEDMGKIIDVIVDRSGGVRAAVIDFGGFLGVGSRKIVVEWNALRFGRVADKTDSVTLELTKDQVKAAPEYKEDAPVVVLGATGALEPLQFDDQ